MSSSANKDISWSLAFKSYPALEFIILPAGILFPPMNVLANSLTIFCSKFYFVFLGSIFTHCFIFTYYTKSYTPYYHAYRAFFRFYSFIKVFINLSCGYLLASSYIYGPCLFDFAKIDSGVAETGLPNFLASLFFLLYCYFFYLYYFYFISYWAFLTSTAL